MDFRYLSAVAIIATTGFAGTGAVAQEPGSFYLKAFGGGSMLRSAEVTGDVAGTASFGTGPVVGAAWGYDYGDNPFRSEIEYAYRSGPAEPFAGGASGDFASTSLLVNGYYDFAAPGRLVPYVGAGAGYVTEIDFDIAGGAAPGQYSARGGFAWQAMAGVTFAVTDRIGISGELRYFDAGSRALAGSGGSITADHAAFEAIVGLSLSF